MDAGVKPHPAALATTQADTENNISEIEGPCDVESFLLNRQPVQTIMTFTGRTC